MVCVKRENSLELRAGKCRMGRSAAKSQGNVGKFYIAWRVVTLCSATLPPVYGRQHVCRASSCDHVLSFVIVRSAW